MLAIHRIRDVARFRRAEARPHPERPPELRLIQALPARQRHLCVLLWDAPSVEAVRRYSEAVYGRSSDVECVEIDAAEALGLRVSRLPDERSPAHLGEWAPRI